MGEYDLDLDKELAKEDKLQERLAQFATFALGFICGILICTILVALARF